MRISTLFFTLALLLVVSAPVKAVIVTPPPAATEATSLTPADIAAAKAEHKAMLDAMTPAERRAYKRDQKRAVKQALKEYKEDVASGKRAADDSTILLVILALFIPPLAVFLHQEAINSKFWISLLLTLLFFLPGVIYAILVITGNAKK
jgi:uncharacterized membrane protein YqaE (UPF0057 family)